MCDKEFVKKEKPSGTQGVEKGFSLIKFVIVFVVLSVFALVTLNFLPRIGVPVNSVITFIGNNPFPFMSLTLILLFILVGMLLVFEKRRSLESRKSLETFKSRLETLLKELKSEKKISAIEEKKRKFLSLSKTSNITFRFKNEKEIERRYNDWFSKLKIEELVSEFETTGEFGADIKAVLPKFLESRIGGKRSNIEKWISKLKVLEESLESKFLQYQKTAIEKEQVTLGLEEVDIELSEVEEFDHAVEQLEGRFGLNLDENVPELLEKQRNHLKEKAAKRTLDRLENTSGLVLLEAQFVISRDEEGDYKCTCRHPVSDYLSEREIIISFLLPPDSLEKSVTQLFAQSVDNSIPLKVYGEVFAFDKKNDELKLMPLAVY